jgi:hypothetical protein
MPTFDKTPSQISFSMKAGESAAPQVMQIGGIGPDALQWRLIASTFNDANFLSVSATSGTGATRITVGVVPENLPGAGATPGVYTGRLLFVSARSTVTIPVRVSVGSTEPKAGRIPMSEAEVSHSAASEPATAPTNLFPASTVNCYCGEFVSFFSNFGGLAAAPDGTSSAQLIGEANPENGPQPHVQSIYADMGAGQHTISFHFKADIPNYVDHWVYITSQVDGGGVQRAFFDVAAGTYGSLPAGWTAQITAVPGAANWYRASVTFTAAGSAVNNGFGLAYGDGLWQFTGTYGNGVYEWGQQFENGPLSPYQAKVSPCLSFTKTADAASVPAGSPIGYTIGVFNHGSLITPLNISDPLPNGTGINWSISPYTGPGICNVTGAVGSQMLNCDFSGVPPGLASGAGQTVHVTSLTTASSCGTYSSTATVSSSAYSYSTTASASTTVTCSTFATITSPTPGTALASTSVTFIWNAIGGADQYWLDIGSTVGGSDLWRGALTATSQLVTGLPCDGRTINAQLFTHLNGAWSAPQRYTYTAPTGCYAILTTPTPGAVLTSSTVTFGWSAANGADQYWLDIGSTVGGSDLWRGALTTTSQLVTGLPCDGRTINAQLFTHLNGAWSAPQRYTYTAAGCIAVLTSPAPGTVLTSTNVTFGWNTVAGADQYWLDIGSTVGGSDLWRGALTATSQLVTGLPCDGRTINAQLFTHLNGAWSAPQRFTYTAPTGCFAILTLPTPGTTLTSTTVTFGWTAANGADQYWLDIGSTVAGSDLWRGALTATSQLVTGLPCDGRTINAQLYTHRNGAWLAPLRYTYTAPTGCFAMITSPTPGTVLPSKTITFTWSAANGADQYWLDVGTSVSIGDIWRGALTGTAQIVTGIPCNGSTIYVQLYTHVNGAWLPAIRYTYTAGGQTCGP